MKIDKFREFFASYFRSLETLGKSSISQESRIYFGCIRFHVGKRHEICTSAYYILCITLM